MVEAKLHDNFQSAYGVDINPLAILISTVKTTPINPNLLKTILNRIVGDIIKERKKTVNNAPIEAPIIKNIDYWFKPEVIVDLSIIKKSIELITYKDKQLENDLKKFFCVSFSETVRLASNTRNSEFKLYRMASLLNFHPNAVLMFVEKSIQNIERMKLFYKSAKNCDIVIFKEDSRKMESVPSNFFDLIITSPPYGDSKTTVAYGQFSRLSLEWLNFQREETLKIDKSCLGGKKYLSDIHLESPILDQTLDEIKKIDSQRADEVRNFYLDFFCSLQQMDRILKEHGTMCFVLGNRKIKGITIPTNEILIELIKSIGDYDDYKTITRTIHNKRLPNKNSPTNIKGNLDSTINKEYIVIMRNNNK